MLWRPLVPGIFAQLQFSHRVSQPALLRVFAFVSGMSFVKLTDPGQLSHLWALEALSTAWFLGAGMVVVLHIGQCVIDALLHDIS